MNGDSDRSVNIKASVNGKELRPESLASVLDVLFRGGWLDDVIKTALGAHSAAMERVNLNLTRQMQTLKETLAQAANTAEEAAAKPSEEPKQGEKL